MTQTYRDWYGQSRRLVAIGDANWNYYHIAGSKTILSIPKMGRHYAGCQPTGFGDIAYFVGHMTRRPGSVRLTEYGRNLLARS